MAHQDEFFRPGGTLPPGSQSYVMRRADDEIFDALTASEFVFVLDSRQKGKSSLIVRSLERLRQQGITTIRIDLQRLGANLGAEQWYAGLLHSIGQELGLTRELFAYWKENIDIGPMARWFSALEHVVLASIEGPIVVFVDEVDYVQSLPFAADEFFAGIRECYNRRSSAPIYRRITFCLAGVATPSQLIRNEDVTPFNVGKRVRLTDFTRAEIEPYETPLSSGGRDGKQIVDGIHRWVNGHPYLTQLLASCACTDSEIRTSKDVDGLVHRVLLNSDAREQEPNVADTERRLLEASLPDASKDESRSRILEEYRLLLQSNTILVNREGSVTSTLLLSGVAIENGGHLQIRNRLYRQLFDERWRRNNLPDAEMRRQRSASARAAWRVASIAFAILCVVTTLWLRLLVLTHDRDRALAESRRLNAVNIKSTYEASIALTWARIEDGNYVKAYQLMESQKSAPVRDWEWDFLSALFEEAKILKPPDPHDSPSPHVFTAWKEGNSLLEATEKDILKDGKLLAVAPSGRYGGGFTSWLFSSRNTRSLNERLAIAHSVFSSAEQRDLYLSRDATKLAIHVPKENGFDVVDRVTGKKAHFETKYVPHSLIFTNSGQRILVLAPNAICHFYDCKSKIQLWEADLAMSGTPAFSPDDSLAVIPRVESKILIIRTSDGAVVSNLAGHTSPPTAFTWFSDGKRLVSSSYDGSARIWDATKGRQLRLVLEGRSAFLANSLTSGERSAIFSTRDGSVLEWQFDGRPPIQTLTLHKSHILGCTVSPSGERCLTSSVDGTAVLLDIAQGRPIARFFLGSLPHAHAIRFSPDEKFAALVGTDGSATFIDPSDGHVMRRLTFGGKHPIAIAISKKGRILMPVGEGGIECLEDWRSEPIYNPAPGFVCARICLSSDDRWAGVGGQTGEIAVLDAESLKTKKLLDRRKSPISGIEFSRDCRSLAASCLDGHALVFSLDGSSKTRDLQGHWSRVWGVAFSPDGSRLLTNSFDGTARVWNSASGDLVSVLQHGSWVSSAVWSPDGKRILTGCGDNFMRIFDPSDGFELLKLSGHEGFVMDAKFTPDGKTVVSVSSDNTLKLWRSENFIAAQSGSAKDTRGRHALEIPISRQASE